MAYGATLRSLQIRFEAYNALNRAQYVPGFANSVDARPRVDGNGSLFGTLAGNTREVIHKFTVDLPKKHGRGGQSALRFSRLRDEKRHNYVRKVAELAVQHFITNDKVNVAGLVLAGSADFKTELSQSDMLDQRLAAKIIKVVDVSYGGENGFNQVGLQRIYSPK